MSKKITLLLCVFSRIVLGMDQNGVLMKLAEHGDLFPHVTEHVCDVNDWDFDEVKKDFHSLSLTNKFCRDYYTREAVQQSIISKFMNRWNSINANHFVIAKELCCHSIAKKITYFHDVACDNDKSFTDEDLKSHNAWYLNSTVDTRIPLLNGVIERKNVDKAQLLIDHLNIQLVPDDSVRFYVQEKQCPLYYVAKLRCGLSPESDQNDLLAITRLLLKKMSPDYRPRCKEWTVLMKAALSDQKELARLLLEHGANPFLLVCCFGNRSYTVDDTYDHIKQIPNHSDLSNAFTLERGQPKGWLWSMYNEVQQKK